MTTMTAEGIALKQRFEQIVSSIASIVVGKELQSKLALICLFADGHLLIEDIPGIGKTTLAKTLAVCLGLEFRRVQFTSDLLPGDILGASVFDRQSNAFIFHPGPVFTNMLLADEINRATPKTQSALLEAMEESQVSIEGKTYSLKPPFFVIATQNPFEHAGTYSLPDSQLDRFLMRISLGYPDRKAEADLLKGRQTRQLLAEMTPCINGEQVIAIQQRVSQVHISKAFLDYLQNILEFTRTSRRFQCGLSPRAGLSLVQAAKAKACLEGRDFSIPEDLQYILPYIVGHRLKSSEDLSYFEPEALNRLLLEIPIP